jgi:hypothetical protein
MLRLDDQRWNTLLGGRRTVYDPRLALAKLQSGTNDPIVWEELWDELHHQGDVGEASYAFVPHLVRIYRERPSADWNVYAIIGITKLGRKRGSNPDVPAWLDSGYFQAIEQLANLGCLELHNASDPELVRAILSIIAIAKGARTHAWFLLNYSEDEMLDVERIWLEHG